MSNYKYFTNVKDHVAFTNQLCQFCGSDRNCLEGVYFDNPDIKSACLDCLIQKRVRVSIPQYVKQQIKHNEQEKTSILMQTPPVPWVQYNDWPACCDDYMEYLGEWNREDFERKAKNGDGINLLKNIMRGDQLVQIDDMEILWDSIGDDTVIFVFRCLICGKLMAVCQSY